MHAVPDMALQGGTGLRRPHEPAHRMPTTHGYTNLVHVTCWKYKGLVLVARRPRSAVHSLAAMADSQGDLADAVPAAPVADSLESYQTQSSLGSQGSLCASLMHLTAAPAAPETIGSRSGPRKAWADVQDTPPMDSQNEPGASLTMASQTGMLCHSWATFCNFKGT